MDLHAGARKRQSDVVRGLTAHGDHDTGRLLERVDVHDGLEADVFEVQAVGLVVIGRYGLRIKRKWGQYVSIKYCCDVG